MTDNLEKNSHFKNESVDIHLNNVKQKAALSREEIHSSQHYNFHVFLHESRKMGIFLFLLRTFVYFSHPEISLKPIPLIFIGFTLIFIRSAMLTIKSWEYLEFSHRTIEQERKEIEDNPEEEKEEIFAIYEAKGFKDDLLNNITDYLTSDSNLLLNAMVEDELKLEIEKYPHPLKQGLISFYSATPALLLFIPALLIPNYMISGSVIGLLFATLSGLKARSIGNNVVTSFIWNAAFFTTTFITFYIFSNLFR